MAKDVLKPSLALYFRMEVDSGNVMNTDRVEKDDVGVCNFPEHLLNTSLRTSGSAHALTCRRSWEDPMKLLLLRMHFYIFVYLSVTVFSFCVFSFKADYILTTVKNTSDNKSQNTAAGYSRKYETLWFSGLIRYRL